MTKTVQIDMKRLTRLADKAREVGKLKRRIREDCGGAVMKTEEDLTLEDIDLFYEFTWRAIGVGQRAKYKAVYDMARRAVTEIDRKSVV